MPIKNVVFDVGQVLLEWNPPAVIARLHPDPALQALIRREMFEHADWHEFDRGGLSEAGAIEKFAGTTGLSREQIGALIHATRESLVPVPGTIQLVEDLAAAGIHLYLLSNMPVSTYDYLIDKHAFFAHFTYLVSSGQILLIKPDPAIYQPLVENTGIVAGAGGCGRARS